MARPKHRDLKRNTYSDMPKGEVRKINGKKFVLRTHETTKKEAKEHAEAARNGKWKYARVIPCSTGGYDIFVRGKKSGLW